MAGGTHPVMIGIRRGGLGRSRRRLDGLLLVRRVCGDGRRLVVGGLCGGGRGVRRVGWVVAGLGGQRWRVVRRRW